MNTQRSLERSIARWMADEAAGAADDALLDTILLATGRARPQPRWLALLQEPPMRLDSRVAVGSSTARLALVLALMGVLLLGAVAAAAVLQSKPSTIAWAGVRGDAAHTAASEHGPVGNPTVQWTFATGGSVAQNLSVADDLVLAPSDDGILHALDIASGAERWSFDAATPPMGGPVIEDGRVFVADGSGTLYALDLGTGTERWRAQIAVEPAAGLTVADGRVFTGLSTGDFVAIDTGDGTINWRASLGDRLNSWRPPASDAGRVFVGIDGRGLVAFSASSGEQLWTFDTPGASLGTPVVAGDTVFLAGGPTGSPGQLWALDVSTGAARWTTDDLGTPAVADGVGYAEGAPGVVSAYDLATGAIHWQVSFQGVVRPLAIAGGIVYVPADTERRVYALDAASGGELWSIAVDGPNECCIAVSDGQLFAGSTLGSAYAIGGDGASLTPQPRTASPATPTPAPATPAPTPSPAGSPTPEPSPLAEFVWQATSPEIGFVSAGLDGAPDGQLWVSDVDNGRFAIFDADGTYLESWGQAGTGKGEFNLRRSNGDPYGRVAFAPDGSFFVLDVGNRRVQAFDANRRPMAEWGGFGNEPGRFSDPVGIAVGPDGNVSVLDDIRNVVETYRPDGTVVGSFNPLTGVSSGANALAIDAEGNVYVSVVAPNEIRRFDPDGNATGTFGSPGSGAGAFSDQPGPITVDTDGRVFTTQISAPSGALGVLAFAPDGSFLGGWGRPGRDPGQLGFPWGIALDGAGNAYVSEYGGDEGIPSENRIQAFHLTLP